MACLVTYCRVGSVKADCRWHNFAGVLVVGVGRGREFLSREDVVQVVSLFLLMSANLCMVTGTYPIATRIPVTQLPI